MIRELPPPTLALREDPGARGPVRRTWSLRTSFWLVVAAQVLLFAGSNLPTPLFPLYQHRYGFGPGTVTALFAVYVVPLIPTLLLVGRVADRIGRRPLLVAGIAFTVVSSIAFAAAQSLALAVRRRARLRRRQRAGDVVRLRRHPRAAPRPARDARRARRFRRGRRRADARSARQRVPRVGRRRGRRCRRSCSTSCWRRCWLSALAPHPRDAAGPPHVAHLARRSSTSRPRSGWRSCPSPSPAPPASPSSPGCSGCRPRTSTNGCGVQITQPVVDRAVRRTGAARQRRDATHSSAATTARRSCAPRSRRASSGWESSRPRGTSRHSPSRSSAPILVGAGSGVAQMNALACIQHIAPLHARGGVTSAYYTLCYLAMACP